MAKSNYQQVRRQKENARKARQQAKITRKLARGTELEGSLVAPSEGPIATPEVLEKP